MRARYPGDDQTFEGNVEPEATTGRHGPAKMENDPWDAAWVGDSDRYHGRRRASVAGRRWLMVTVAMLAIAGTVTLVATLGTSDDAPTTAAVDEGTRSPDDTASSSASGAPTTSPAFSPTATQSAQTSTTALPFAAVTFEAEAGSPFVTLSGSARVQAETGASGGKIVSRLGAWGGGQAPGVLRVNNVTIPASGTYIISIYYTNADNPGSSSGTVSVSGAKAVTVKFTGGRGCCGVRQVEIALAAGVHTITISNQTEMAPSVDKIAVSRPA